MLNVKQIFNWRDQGISESHGILHFHNLFEGNFFHQCCNSLFDLFCNNVFVRLLIIVIILQLITFYMRNHFGGELFGPSHIIFINAQELQRFLVVWQNNWSEWKNFLHLHQCTCPGNIFKAFFEWRLDWDLEISFPFIVFLYLAEETSSIFFNTFTLLLWILIWT